MSSSSVVCTNLRTRYVGKRKGGSTGGSAERREDETEGEGVETVGTMAGRERCYVSGSRSWPWRWTRAVLVECEYGGVRRGGRRACNIFPSRLLIRPSDKP